MENIKLVKCLESAIPKLYLFNIDLKLIYSTLKLDNLNAFIKEHNDLILNIKNSDSPIYVNEHNNYGGMLFPNGDVLVISANLKCNHNETAREKIKAIKSLLDIIHFMAFNVIDEDNFIENSQIIDFKAKFKDMDKVNLNDFLPTESPHNTSSYEVKFLDAVTQGDPDKALRALRAPMHGKEGRLGFTQLRHYKNSVIINATVCARAAIKAGLRAESAYTLADYFILSAEASKTNDEAIALREQCTYKFAQFVRDYKEKLQNNYSKTVLKILDEIERNIFIKVTRSDIVSCVALNVDYVQRLFKAEVGHSIMDHLRIKRIESAKEILLNSDVKIGEIASLLHFSSTSHFAKIFKELEGISPLEYKQKHQSDVRI